MIAIMMINNLLGAGVQDKSLHLGVSLVEMSLKKALFFQSRRYRELILDILMS